MMTPTGAAGVRDALVDGAAELGLPLSRSLLSLLRCEEIVPCGQGRCPICASTVAMRLHGISQAPALGLQRWQRSAYALRSYSYAATDLTTIPVDRINSGIAKILDGYVRSFLQQDSRGSTNYGCIAQFGLVEDTSPAGASEKVVVVEFILTGGNNETDYDMFANLHAQFGDELYTVIGYGDRREKVQPVPLVSTEGSGILPDQGLLFGYTKRRLDRAERPTVISSKKRLARMAFNYGEHSLRNRSFSRGLTNTGNELVFEQDARDNLSETSYF
ncbi:hypothetical protein [Rhizobium leguminosarum]|uniref:hypothetical protein n=1 Tax=Rhizobium leguminosarum TaxID=384 RepID=UPI0010321973|nr:hypothetical protein [Rhizobium leguminosarum]TAU81970.1 hypothetical protein ELI40_01015 [Rhizobium leguminosarum]